MALTGCSSSPAPVAEPASTTTVATVATSATTAATTTTTAAPASTTTTEATTTTVAGPDLIADRPFVVELPDGYDRSKAAPLLVVLHGYTGDRDSVERFFKLREAAARRGYLLVRPNGTLNRKGEGFWNATVACCDYDNSNVDDVAYLAALVERVGRDHNLDRKRVYFIGHSNGGFMSYRMACDRADVVAAVVSLAGATFADADDCRPTEPVSVVQVHGTDDSIIRFEGGTFRARYPSATESVAQWAARNGCDLDPVDSPTQFDLDRAVDGAESTVSAHPRCQAGTAAELWTIPFGSHSPPLTSAFAEHVLDFFDGHPKT